MRLDRPTGEEGIIRYMEMRFTHSGRQVLMFTLQRDSAGEDLIECEAWGALAEEIVAQWDEGQRITLTGSIKTQNYTLNDEPKTRTFFGVREVH